MTGSLIFERTNNYSCAFPSDRSSAACGKLSYKLVYQVELRQLLREDRTEHKSNRHATENKRLVMDRHRDRTKLQARNSDHEKSPASKDATSSIPLSPNVHNANSITLSKLKPTGKPKHASTASKHHHGKQKHVPVKPLMDLPTIEIDDDTDDNLLYSNAYSYTQALPSSHDHDHESDQLARQAMLKTIMSHFDTCAPPGLSRWGFYREFHCKIAESASSDVYRKFERVIL